MTNEAFQALLARGPVLLDGATGSNLMRAGMPRGICTEVWVTEHPEPLLALQRDYIAAGSQIIYAPTFCANRRGLARCGRENDVALLNRQLARGGRRPRARGRRPHNDRCAARACRDNDISRAV